MPKEEIPRGQLSNIILSTLLDTDKYGYEIIDTIKEKTNGNVIIKQPSLYSSLRRMEEQGLISSYWRDSEIGGRRHYYSITDYGKKYAEKWQTDLSVFSTTDYNKNIKANENINQETNQQNISQGTILQQENLFKNKIVEKEEDKEEPIQETHNFVQFDLFTSPTLISEPSNEVFDSIKTLRESADIKKEDTNDKIDNLSNLRNYKNEEIKTSYVADNYNIHNTKNIDEIKKNFYELSKKQKSFVEAVKDNEISNDNIKTEYVNNELSLKNLETLPIVDSMSTNDAIEETTLNLEQILKSKVETNDTNKNTKQNDDINIVNQKTVYNTDNNIFEQKPTIYQTTKYDNEDEYINNNEINNNSSSNVEFIDLNNIEYSSEPKEANSSSFINKEENNEQNSNKDISFINNDALLNNDDIIHENKPVENDIPEPLSPISNKDDAVLITDKPDFSNIPKVKKIAPARFENYARNYVDSINNKISAHYHKENEINENFDKEENDTKTIIQEKQKPPYYNDLSSLKNYYSEYGLKFNIYKKQTNSHNLNYVKINKMNFISYMSISILIIIESIVLFCLFKHQQPSWNFLYLLLPAIALGITTFYAIKFIKNRNAVTNKNNVFNFNFMYKILMSIIFIMIVFSINLLCGMSFNDTNKYITTFIYISIFSLHYPLLNLVNYILYKSNVINLK